MLKSTERVRSLSIQQFPTGLHSDSIISLGQKYFLHTRKNFGFVPTSCLFLSVKLLSRRSHSCDTTGFTCTLLRLLETCIFGDSSNLLADLPRLWQSFLAFVACTHQMFFFIEFFIQYRTSAWTLQKVSFYLSLKWLDGSPELNTFT